AFSASLLGGLLGDFCGFYVLPQIIFNIFKSMYALTDYLIRFDFIYGIVGILLFLVCITGAAIYACRDALKNVPAVLMRPKVPQSGSRVLLEKISFIWKRLSFLNKVTARNIFRYKKRLIMTLLGVMGCTALIICGFAIKDSLDELLPYQYDWLNPFDYLATAETEHNDALIEGLETNPDVDEFINVQMETVKVKNANGDSDSMQIMAMPENEGYEKYIYIESAETNEPLYLMGGGVYLTENAARMLGVKRGDKIIVQDLALKETEVEITGVAKNYLGNKIYMGKKAYTKFFGEYKPNTIMVRFNEGANEKAFGKMIAEREGVVYTLSIAEVREDFSRTFAIVNVAVLIIISLAIGLAFVVLFTLSATNISERSRELATIKVLGFFNNEVHLYVNKETFLLTVMGIILGLPAGHYLGGLLTYSLKMPAVTFVQVIHPITYVYAVVISVVIALFVSLLTNISLNGINPVEALKSVE
ncbi:MAG: ABC transporter permease, partial [Clostridia bacterium]|nr:ABC transporter permease [Clostridia bacterium]